MAPRKKLPGVDAKLLITDAAKLLPEPSRRFFLRGAGSLGALAVLSGCDIIDGDTSEVALRVVSRFNDRVQAWLFNPNALAPEYPESAITRPFPFNGYYSQDEAPDVDGETYQLEIGGLVDSFQARSIVRMSARRLFSATARNCAIICSFVRPRVFAANASFSVIG